MRCGYCGSLGHTINHCPKTWAGSINRRLLRCTYCGGQDHNQLACPKIRAAHMRPATAYVTDKG